MIKKIVNALRDIYRANQYACRLVDFDVKRQEVILQLKMKSVIFRMLLVDVIRNHELMRMLTPFEACWLGGYYGRYSRVMTHHSLISQHPFSDFSLRQSDNRYQLISLNRENELVYVDRFNQALYCEHPLALVNNENVIARFDHMQAYYIGYLAGVYFENNLRSRAKSNSSVNSITRPSFVSKLRVVN